MVELDEQYIKTVLGEHESLHENIHQRILDIHRELMDTDGVIRSVSIKKIEWDKEGGGSEGIKRDLLDAMLLHQRLTRERELELRAAIWGLTEEQEKINRIWVCFQSLRGKPYIYLDNLYVKQRPYKAVEAESGVSHRTFEKVRREGIQQILRLYNSDISNLQIIRGGRKQEKEQQLQKRKKVYSEFEQLTLKI